MHRCVCVLHFAFPLPYITIKSPNKTAGAVQYASSDEPCFDKCPDCQSQFTANTLSFLSISCLPTTLQFSFFLCNQCPFPFNSPIYLFLIFLGEPHLEGIRADYFPHLNPAVCQGWAEQGEVDLCLLSPGCQWGLPLVATWDLRGKEDTACFLFMEGSSFLTSFTCLRLPVLACHVPQTTSCSVSCDLSVMRCLPPQSESFYILFTPP